MPDRRVATANEPAAWASGPLIAYDAVIASLSSAIGARPSRLARARQVGHADGGVFRRQCRRGRSRHRGHACVARIVGAPACVPPAHSAAGVVLSMRVWGFAGRRGGWSRDVRGGAGRRRAASVGVTGRGVAPPPPSSPPMLTAAAGLKAAKTGASPPRRPRRYPGTPARPRSRSASASPSRS